MTAAKGRLRGEMTSVICTVCAQNITAENDRIYCFGGCEQILHIRCAEISSAAANAMRSNNALKYLCFDCRKKQTSLNDIRLLCTQLVSRLDDVYDRVNKYDATLKSMLDAHSKSIESAIISRVLSEFNNKNVPSVSSLTTVQSPISLYY